MGIICCLNIQQKTLERNKLIESNFDSKMILLKEKQNAFDYFFQYLSNNESNDENTLIISSSSDIEGNNSISLFDWNFEKINKIDNPHKNRITSAASFSSKLRTPCTLGSLFVTGDADGIIKIWDRNLIELICERKHVKSVLNIGVISHPLSLISLSGEKLISWELIYYKKKLKLLKMKSIESSDYRGMVIIPINPKKFLIAISRVFNEIILYDSDLKEIKRIEKAHSGIIISLKYLKYYNKIFLVSVAQDEKIKIWDLDLNLIKEKQKAQKDPWGLETLNYRIDDDGMGIGLIATYSLRKIKIWNFKLECLKIIQEEEISCLNVCQIDNKIYLIIGTPSKKLLIYE